MPHAFHASGQHPWHRGERPPFQGAPLSARRNQRPRTSEERLDGENHAISVSISAINAEMFWAKDQACGHPPWVVLLLDPSILWTQDCCFFWRNAASEEVREHGRFLGGPYGFRRIFEDVSFKWPPESHRAEAGVPDHLPTFSDAKVQVFNAIDPQRIIGAWVTDLELGGVVDGLLRAKNKTGRCRAKSVT